MVGGGGGVENQSFSIPRWKQVFKGLRLTLCNPLKIKVSRFRDGNLSNKANAASVEFV